MSNFSLNKYLITQSLLIGTLYHYWLESDFSQIKLVCDMISKCVHYWYTHPSVFLQNYTQYRSIHCLF